MAKKSKVSESSATATQEPAKGAVSCPLSPEEFEKDAKSLTMRLGTKEVVLRPKQFSTGSFGWHGGEKIDIEVGGVPLKVQIGINATVLGSKKRGGEAEGSE
jgi:hypothetical protein